MWRLPRQSSRIQFQRYYLRVLQGLLQAERIEIEGML